jgi:hypothetical protein
MNYQEQITTRVGSDYICKRVDNSRFKGTKETFTNLNRNKVDVFRDEQGNVFSIDEYQTGEFDVVAKLGGVYEVPEDHRLRDCGQWLLVEKQAERTGASGQSLGKLDEYSIRVFAKCDDDGLDESILGISGCELRDIVKEHKEKNDDCFNMTLHYQRGKRGGHSGVTIYNGYPVRNYIIYAGGNSPFLVSKTE